MRITLLQTDIHWGDNTANQQKAEQMMDAEAGSELYILPEMWNTGFDTSDKIRPLLSYGSDALEWMRKNARKRNCAIAGSMAIMEEGRLFNRLYLVKPDGSAVHYDKRHLFGIGGEDRTFTAGHGRTVCYLNGWRILLLTCYDLRFPVFARNRNDYDMMICVASWPESRQAVWQTLLKARAIENQCIVCGVNRTGRDPLCHYAGGSVIIDAYGRELLNLGDAENAGTAKTDLHSLQTFRRKFPVLKDADAFTLKD